MKRKTSAALGCFLLFFSSCTTVTSYTYGPDSLLLNPAMETSLPPEGFREDNLKAEDGTALNILYNSVLEDYEYCVLYLHGNGDTVWSAGLRPFYSLLNAGGLVVCAVDYRGYGKSGGQSAIDTLQEDARTAYDFLSRHFDPGRIIIWGKSLGTVPALLLARDRPESPLVLESTISNLEDLEGPLERLFSTRFRKVDLILRNTGTFDNTLAVKGIHNRTFMIHGEEDPLAGFDSARKMYEDIPAAGKTFIPLPGEGHNYSSFSVLRNPLEIILTSIKNGEEAPHERT